MIARVRLLDANICRRPKIESEVMVGVVYSEIQTDDEANHRDTIV